MGKNHLAHCFRGFNPGLLDLIFLGRTPCQWEHVEEKAVCFRVSGSSQYVQASKPFRRPQPSISLMSCLVLIVNLTQLRITVEDSLNEKLSTLDWPVGMV